MKIGLIGTGGTGKTTLLNTLTTTWEKYGLIKLPVEMREVLSRFGVSNEQDLMQLESDDLFEVQYLGLNTRLNAEDTHQETHWYSDRTALDHLLYIILWCGAAEVTEEIWEYYCPKIVKSLQSYDLIFYFPKAVFHNPDGIRLDHYLYHEIFDQLALSFLQKWSINYTTIASGDIQKRREQVLEAVESKKSGE